MATKSTPDIKNGNSLLKIISLSIGLPSILIASVFIFLQMYGSKNEEEKNIEYVKKIESNGLPSDFFSKYVPVEEVEEVKEVMEKPKKTQPPKTIIVYRDRPIEKTNLNSSSMFNDTTLKIDTKKIKEQQIRDKINAARMKNGASTMVATNNQGFASASSFSDNNTDKNWLRYGVTQDKTSYPVNLERVITIDRMFSCILVNEIISDLQGKVTCKIEENLYGAHGRKILIPAQSTGIGFYQPLKRIGDERISINWTRIITPEGININTTKAQSADQMGRSGITGDVDNRYTERYGLALLSSAITSAASYSIPVDSINQQIVVSNMTQDLGTVTNKILDEHINIKPRVTIQAGSRVFINPVVDIWFPEPKNNTNQVTAKEYKGSL
jgi:type IV secretory pathway VirB10-like protein